MLAEEEYDGRHDVVRSYQCMQNVEKLPLPFPGVILANHVFVRPLISQDLATFVNTFKSKYLRRRMGFPVTDKNTHELLNEFFLHVLSSYKSISLSFLFMVADVETFDSIGILSFHSMGIVLSDVPFAECEAASSDAQFTMDKEQPLMAGSRGPCVAPGQGDQVMTPSLIELSPDTPCIEVIITFGHGFRRHGYDRDIIEAVTRYCLRHGCIPMFAYHPAFDSRKFASKTSVTMFKTKIMCRMEDVNNVFFLAYISPEKQ